MKGIFVIIDGMGDRACRQLKGQTPLEAAETENLDYLAREGKQGYVYPINEKIAPESDTAIVSLLGNNPFDSARGQFEALGSGIKLSRGDLAFRTNFATITDIKDGKIIDRRAGRNLSTKEAEILSKALNKIILPCKFIFKPTVQHRGVLVFRGGFSDNITNTDSAYTIKGKYQAKDKFQFSKALDDDENTEYSARVLNDFTEESYKVLVNHPVNKERRKKGLMPANIVIARDAGIELPKLCKLRKWACIVNMPLERGIAKNCKMDVFSMEYPPLKNFDVYRNLYDGLNKHIKFSIKTLKKNWDKYNYFYIHFKETDLPGHDNKPHIKKDMIELIDKKFFSFLKKKLKRSKFKIAVTADHSTPCKLKSHSADPVPLLLYGDGKDETEKYSEKESRKGSLGKIYGKQFMKKIGFK